MSQTTIPVTAKPGPRSLHRPWLVRLILAALFVPPTGYFVYTRWTARPALQVTDLVELLDRAVARPPENQDVSADLAAAFTRLPPLPTLTGPPPAPTGWQWVEAAAFRRNGEMKAYAATGLSLDFETAVDGKWEPQRRYGQGQAVAYLQQPACTKALQDVAVLSTRPYCVSMSSGPGPTLQVVQQVAAGLVFRARMKMNSGDWPGAIEDLEICLNLARGMEDDSTCLNLLWAAVLRSTAAAEAGCLAREFSLSPEQAQAFRALWARHQFEPRTVWAGCLDGESEYALLSLDAQYTGQRGAGGFYVLWDTSTRGRFALGLLNLFSPAYESRSQMEAHYAQLRRQAAGLIEKLDEPENEEPPTRPRHVLPPFCLASGTAMNCWRARVLQDAADTAVVLNLWHREHGSYPASLDGGAEPWRQLRWGSVNVPRASLAMSYQATGDGYVLASEGRPILEREEPLDEALLVEVRP